MANRVVVLLCLGNPALISIDLLHDATRLYSLLSIIVAFVDDCLVVDYIM
jgi:hypothetical protein